MSNVRDREHYNAYMRAYRKRGVTAARHDIIVLLGGVCAACQYEDERALTIDHVNGGGSRIRKQTSALPTANLCYYRRILAEIKEGSTAYRVLCWNCNWIAHRYGLVEE